MNQDDFETLAITLKWLSQRDRFCLVCVENVLGAIDDLRNGRIFPHPRDLDIDKVLCPHCERDFTAEMDAQDKKFRETMAECMRPRRTKIAAYRAKQSAN